MGVAQLVEHLVVVQDVAGSSPVTHPTETVRLVRAVFIWVIIQQLGPASIS